MVGLIRKKPAFPPDGQQPADPAANDQAAPAPDDAAPADPSAPDPSAPPSADASQGSYPEQGESSVDDTKTGAGESSGVSPEEQKQYDQFVNNCYSAIYSGQDAKGQPTPAPAILQSLQASKDPIDNLAHTTLAVIHIVQASAQKAGQQIPDDVIFHGSAEVGEDLANLAKLANIHTYDEKELEAAFYRGADAFRQMGEASGQIDPNDLKQQMGVVAEADKRGMLPKLLPGIDKYAQQKQSAPDQQPGDQPQGGDNGGAA